MRFFSDDTTPESRGSRFTEHFRDNDTAPYGTPTIEVTHKLETDPKISPPGPVVNSQLLTADPLFSTARASHTPNLPDNSGIPGIQENASSNRHSLSGHQATEAPKYKASHSLDNDVTHATGGGNRFHVLETHQPTNIKQTSLHAITEH